MGWGIYRVSSGGSDFHRDLGFQHTLEELKPRTPLTKTPPGGSGGRFGFVS
jgi:hypothetical protein